MYKLVTIICLFVLSIYCLFKYVGMQMSKYKNIDLLINNSMQSGSKPQNFT